MSATGKNENKKRGVIMRTLAEIKNQTKQEQLNILQAVINDSFKKPFEASQGFLDEIFDKASQKIGTQYAEEDGYILTTVDVEIAGYSKGKHDHTQFIDVYIAESYDEEKDEFYTYYAL